MKKFKIIRIGLAVFGSIAAGIGGALLLAPVAFEASAGVVLAQDVGLLNEFRAFGGMLLVSGIIILSGAIIPKLIYISVLWSCLVYSSIGLSRLLGITIDGAPGESLVSAMLIELVIGLISLGILFKLRKQHREATHDFLVL